MSGRVIVVGSVNVDHVVRGPRLPGPGETVTGGQFERHHGGKGGNQAVAAARLGASTLFVGAVGADELGREAREALRAENVDVESVATIDGAPTGVALIVVGDRGENLIAVASGANAALSPALVRSALDRIVPGPGDIVLVSHEIPTDAAGEALTYARATGARSILNPAPADGLDRSTFGRADIVTPNRTELAVLARTDATRIGRRDAPGDDAVRAARMLTEPGPGGPGVREAVVVTLGAAGAFIVRSVGEVIDIPAAAVVAIDATGAGDALNGALAAGLAEGLALEPAVARAVRAATLSTRRVGARAGLVSRSELDGPVT